MKVRRAIMYMIVLAGIRYMWAPSMPLTIVFVPLMISGAGYLLVAYGEYSFLKVLQR